MSFKHFRREVNFVKNLTLFVVFVAGVLLGYFQLIVPKLTNYKTSMQESRLVRAQIKGLQEEFMRLSADMSKQQKANQALLKIVNTPYNAVELSKMLERFLTQFTITEQKNDNKVRKKSLAKEDPVYHYRDILIEGTTTFPENIYSLIDGLKHVGSLVEVRYPVEFESLDGYLLVKMSLRFYFFLE